MKWHLNSPVQRIISGQFGKTVFYVFINLETSSLDGLLVCWVSLAHGRAMQSLVGLRSTPFCLYLKRFKLLLSKDFRQINEFEEKMESLLTLKVKILCFSLVNSLSNSFLSTNLNIANTVGPWFCSMEITHIYTETAKNKIIKLVLSCILCSWPIECFWLQVSEEWGSLAAHLIRSKTAETDRLCSVLNFLFQYEIFSTDQYSLKLIAGCPLLHYL